MDRKPASHLGHVVRIVENFGSIRHSISSEPFIHLISDCLRGGSNLRIPDIPSFPKDTRHFPIREWLCLAADFSTRRILSCVLQEQKAPILRGYWRIVGCNLQILKRLKTVWWTWSGSNRRPLPCHGSALPAAPQAHRQTPSSLHERGRMTRWPALPTATSCEVRPKDYSDCRRFPHSPRLVQSQRARMRPRLE